MKRHSWKYMAGIIDGEGCIDMQGSIDKRDGVFYCRPRLRLVLSGKAGELLIPQFIANFGGCEEPRRAFNNPLWQQPYAWTLTGKSHLRPFLQNIVNHLFIKKEQARLAIWALDNLHGKQAAEKAKRFVYDEMKAMKRDPQRLSEKAVLEIRELMR